MIVISNTSPIVNLATIGQLELLRQLYDRVIIPQAVYNEIVVVGTGQPGVVEVTTFDWIETQQATNRISVASLQLELDQGEAEAIALAAELKADLLLLDEHKGRAIASRLGIRFILWYSKNRDEMKFRRPIEVRKLIQVFSARSKRKTENEGVLQNGKNNILSNFLIPSIHLLHYQFIPKAPVIEPQENLKANYGQFQLALGDTHQMALSVL